jgi:hypothetical protein
LDTPDSTHYRNVAELILAGRVIPFLGAGASLCERPPFDGRWQPGVSLPSGSELAEYLAGKWDYPARESKDLLRVAQYIWAMLGPGVLYEDLRTVFTCNYEPNSVHRLLARLPRVLRARGKQQQLTITTNYDDALERAYDAEGEKYDLVFYDARPDGEAGKFFHRRPSEQPGQPNDPPELIQVPNEFGELDFDTRPVILKIHGAIDRQCEERDSFVITEDDYVDYLVRDEIRCFQALKAPMKQRHFLFLGYSLQDWNLRVILNRIWDERDLGKNSWAIQRHDRRRSPRSLDVERRIWRDRGGVELLFADLTQYVEKLSACIPEPASVPGPEPQPAAA